MAATPKFLTTRFSNTMPIRYNLVTSFLKRTALLNSPKGINLSVLMVFCYP